MTKFQEYWEKILENPKRLAALGAGGVLFFCAVIWYIIVSEAFIVGMADYIGREAGSALKTNVTIGRVEVASFRSVTIKDIVVFDKNDEKMAEAEAADVRFSLFALLREPVAGISEVEISRLRGNISQRKDGSWNYEDLISEEKSENKFAGKIILKEGSAALSLNDGRQAVIEQIKGKLDFGGNPKLKPEFTAVIRGASVALSGEVDTKTGKGSLTAEVENAVAKDFLDLLPAGKMPKEVVIKDGVAEKAQVSMELTGDEPQFGVKAQVKNAAFLAYGAEAAGVGGSIEYDGPREKLRADIGGSVDGEPVKLKGEVCFRDGIITVSGLDAELLEGKLKMAGELGLDTESYMGRLSAEGIDLSRLFAVPMLAEQAGELGLGGRLTCDVGFDGRGFDSSAVGRLTIYGNTELLSPSYGDIVGERLSVSFLRKPSELRLDYLSLLLGENYGRGELGIEGSVFTPSDERRYDLTLRATHFDLGLINQFKENLFMSGYTDITASVRGSESNPQVEADISGVRGKLLGVPFDSFSGLLSGRMSDLQLNGFSLQRDGKERWIAQGSIGLVGEKKLNFRVDTMNERIENLVPVLSPDGPLPVTGEFDNVITVAGTLDKPEVTGYLHLYRGSYNGYLLNGIDGDYTFRGDTVTLYDVHAFSPLVDMDLNGTVNLRKELDIKAAVHDIDMARFDHMLPYPVRGHGRFAGAVTGTVDKPVFDGELVAEKLNLNGAIVEKFWGNVRLADGVINLRPCGFTQNGGDYEADFTLNTRTRKIDGNLNVKNADLAGLLAMADAKTERVNGCLDGNIRLGGSLDNPAVSINGTLLKGDIKGQPLSDMYLEANLLNRVVTLKRFSGVQSGGTFYGAGTIDLDGAIDIKLTANGIDAGIIPHLVDSTVTMRGVIDINATVGGTLAAPTARMTVNVAGGGMGASSFDSMSAEAFYADGVIQVIQAVAEKQERGKTYRILGEGRVPLEALGMRAPGDGEAKQMDLRLTLKDADLSLLPILSKEIDWAMGPADGAIHLSGTIEAPLFYGRIAVKDGALKPKLLFTPFTDINGEIIFNGDSMKLQDLSAKLGKGKMSLAGALRIEGRKPVDYDLTFNADKLEVECPFYKGPFSASVIISPDMFMGREMPLVSGWLDFRDVQLGVPPLSDEETELPDMMMDVDIKVGPRVRLYSSQLFDMNLEGKIHLGGTTRYPVNNGKIDVKKGKFYYLQNRFSIYEGEVRFNQQGEYTPFVDLFAYTRIGRTKVFLSAKGSLGAVDFRLTSSPEMSQTEIMQLLTFRREKGEKGDNKELAYSILDMGLHMSFLGQLEDSLREMLFLDEFTISSRDYSMGQEKQRSEDEKQKNEYNIQIGKYISSKVMLKYTAGVGNNISRVGVRYDFDDRLSMALEQDINKKDTRVGMELRLKF
ncbi:MAG: translocation/assembly module TamB domain-containing protein [Selenomonadaceae bacterium]|nr:translocation/assembly module TamB domain-containing protein [Selenomonadaceae bacterium]